MFLLLLLALCAIVSGSGTVQPTFSCWFSEDGLSKNIVLGYANIEPSEALINVTDSAEPVDDMVNFITPIVLNGAQPSQFNIGSLPYALVLKQIEESTITWNINGLILSVSSNDLTESKRCFNSAFTSQCPTSIPNFCDDGSYCNGQEICFPDMMGGPTGVCHRTTEAIICDDSEMVCNDTIRACISPVKETPPPTDTPTVPTTDAPTLSELPLIVRDVVCQSDSDCEGLVTYCNGHHICNQLTSKCIPREVNYDPCHNYRTTMRKYYSSLSSDTIAPFSIVCLEEERHCMESVTCQTNKDCSDNLICNGVEQCVDNQCLYQGDQSIKAVCHSNIPMTCNESSGCVPVEAYTLIPGVPTFTSNHTAPPSGVKDTTPIIFGVVVSILVLIGFVILGVVLYFEFNTNGSYLHSMDIGKKLTFASQMRNQFGNKYGFNSKQH